MCTCTCTYTHVCVHVYVGMYMEVIALACLRLLSFRLHFPINHLFSSSLGSYARQLSWFLGDGRGEEISLNGPQQIFPHLIKLELDPVPFAEQLLTKKPWLSWLARQWIGKLSPNWHYGSGFEWPRSQNVFTFLAHYRNKTIRNHKENKGLCCCKPWNIYHSIDSEAKHNEGQSVKH